MRGRRRRRTARAPRAPRAAPRARLSVPAPASTLCSPTRPPHPTHTTPPPPLTPPPRPQAISNATSGGTADQIKYLVSQGGIKPLCDLLSCSDARIVTVALEGLENILKVGGARGWLSALAGRGVGAVGADREAPAPLLHSRAPSPASSAAPACPRRQVGEAEKELGGVSGTNPFAQLVDEAEGLDKIEDLQVRVHACRGGGVGV